MRGIPQAVADNRVTRPTPSTRGPKEGPTLAGREAIEAALAAWRDAERRLVQAVDGDADALRLELARHRDEFQRLTADNMGEWIGKLRDAEARRSNATPSTLPFHVAARDTQEIAAEIWEAARSSDEDTPETPVNRRTTPRPTRPGTA